jgi:aconitate hydratase
MVMTHVESDHEILHIAYYETGVGKEGSVDLTLANPSDCTKLHGDDTVNIPDVEACGSGDPVTITLTHADGSTEEIVARHI